MRPPDIPSREKWEVGPKEELVELDFLDDTGCKHMLMYDEDRWVLEEKYNFDCPEMGTAYVGTPAGPAGLRVIHVDVTMFWNEGYTKHQVIPWTTVTCYVILGGQNPTQPRLSGVWLRHLLYTMTSPDDKGLLFLSDEGFNSSYNLSSYQMMSRHAPHPTSFRDPRVDYTALQKAEDEHRKRAQQAIWARQDKGMQEAEEAEEAGRQARGEGGSWWWFKSKGNQAPREVPSDVPYEAGRVAPGGPPISDNVGGFMPVDPWTYYQYDSGAGYAPSGYGYDPNNPNGEQGNKGLFAKIFGFLF